MLRAELKVISPKTPLCIIILHPLPVVGTPPPHQRRPRVPAAVRRGAMMSEQPGLKSNPEDPENAAAFIDAAGAASRVTALLQLAAHLGSNGEQMGRILGRGGR